MPEYSYQWTLQKQTEPSDTLRKVLAKNESILKCYSNGRDLAALTTKRFIMMEKQGLTGMRNDIYSIPYQTILTFTYTMDVNGIFQIYTKNGLIKLTVNTMCDHLEFNQLLSQGINDANQG